MEKSWETLGIVALVFGMFALLGAGLGLLGGLLVGILNGNVVACVLIGLMCGAIGMTGLMAAMLAVVIYVFDTDRALS